MSAPQNAHLPTVMCRHFNGISFEIAHLSFYVNFASKGRAKVRCWSQMCCYPLWHCATPSSPQSSMNRMAIQALEKMETRKFKAKGKGQRESSCGASDSLSSSSTSDCAICLEKYIDGEVRRVFLPGVPWNLEGMKELFHFSEASHRLFFFFFFRPPSWQTILSINQTFFACSTV